MDWWESQNISYQAVKEKYKMMERSTIKQHSEEVQYSTNRGAQTVDQGCPKYLRFDILNTIKYNTADTFWDCVA